MIKCEERYSYEIYKNNKDKHPLIYFRGKGISHIGYLINDSTMIHCDSKGVNIMDLHSHEYKQFYGKLRK